MNGTPEVHATPKRPPGLENPTGAELARLAAYPKLREVVRAEFSRRPELLKVACRGGCGKRLRLSDSEPPQPNCRYICKECCGDRSVLDTPSEIEKVLEGKLSGQKRRIYETLASTRASRGPYIVDYANGEFGFSEGGYKPYRREKVKETACEWRKNNPERAAENKRRNRQGISYVDSREELMSDAAWEGKLKEYGYACSTPDCRRSLSLKRAIRSAEGPTYVPVCASCRGRKAAATRWEKRKKLEKR